METFLLITLYVLIFTDIANAKSLESCLIEDKQPAICFKDQESYSTAFPIALDTVLYLQQIVKIDEDQSSITLQVELQSDWTDLGLDSSNKTMM